MHQLQSLKTFFFLHPTTGFQKTGLYFFLNNYPDGYLFLNSNRASLAFVDGLSGLLFGGHFLFLLISSTMVAT